MPYPSSMGLIAKRNHGGIKDAAHPFRGAVMVAASALIFCASVAVGQVALVRQNSVPGAITATTTRLLLKGVVTDAGVGVQLFRLQGEGGRVVAGRRVGGLRLQARRRLLQYPFMSRRRHGGSVPDQSRQWPSRTMLPPTNRQP